MPPSDSATPPVVLIQEEIEEWHQKLKWQKELNEQTEHRLQREGIFWHDKRLDGLSDDDRMWEIIKMSFRQVAQVLASVGLVHFFEYFLQRGILGAKHLRLLTLKYVETKMPEIRDAEDRRLIVEAAAECMQDEEMRFFEARYGDIDRLILDSQHARRFLSEKLLHEQRMIDQYDLTAPLHAETNSFFTKWTVPRADFASFDQYEDWVAASSCDGMLFLWPIIEGDRTPPVVRCKSLHSAPCVDFVMDWNRMEAVTCGLDNKVNLYNLKENEVVSTFRDGRDGNDAQVFLCVDAQLEGAGLAALGTNFGKVKVLDLQRMQLVTSLLGHSDHCRALSVDWERRLLVSCSWDSYVHLYDLRSSKLVQRFEGHNGNCVALEVDWQHMVAASSAAEYRFILWDLEERKLIQRYDSPGHNVNCLSLNTEEGTLATGSDDGLVKLWNLAADEASDCDSRDSRDSWQNAWERSIDCKHHMTLAMDVDWSRKKLVTASWDYNVDMWDLQTGDHLHHFFKPRRCMTQVRMKKACDAP